MLIFLCLVTVVKQSKKVKYYKSNYCACTLDKQSETLKYHNFVDNPLCAGWSVNFLLTNEQDCKNEIIPNVFGFLKIHTSVISLIQFFLKVIFPKFLEYSGLHSFENIICFFFSKT